MGQKKAAEQRVMLHLHGSALAHTFNPLRTPTAGAMQRQPMPSRLQPVPHNLALSGVWVGAGDIGDQEPAGRQPLPDVGEIVANRGRNAVLSEQGEQAEPRIVMVVSRG